MARQPQTLRLERERAATCEGVMKRRKYVPVEQLAGARMVGILGAGPPPALPDLLARPVQDLLVGSVLPLDEVFDDLE